MLLRQGSLGASTEGKVVKSTQNDGICPRILSYSGDILAIPRGNVHYSLDIHDVTRLVEGLTKLDETS